MTQQKKFHPFYICPIGYVLSAYLLFGFILLFDKCPSFTVMASIPLCFAIINIIISICFCKSENRILFLNAMVFMKYGMIPFYLIGGLLVAISFLISFIPVPFMIFVGIPLALFLASIGWFLLVFQVPYTISYLYLSVKTGYCKKGMAWLHAFLQFFFFADVIDVMCITLKEHKWRKTTIAIISIFGILIVLLLLLIVGDIIFCIASN